MKRHALDKTSVAFLSAALFVVMTIYLPAQAQSPESSHDKKISGKMAQHCAAMNQQHQKMRAEMKAQDAEVDELVAKMNSAPQDRKVELMAQIITRMVKQRSAMHSKMVEMRGPMPMGMGGNSDCAMMDFVPPETAHEGWRAGAEASEQEP